ncbi:PilT/PilU family type 4a pilus ATPase [Candidatus Contubernalis alkalaceticus]|nr:PilT/PilU family type 4a pilus ATPase [Candidatus Contubernalis alkalaceticus]
MAVNEEASDLHLTVNFPPSLRLDGKLVTTSLPPLRPQETESIAREIIPPSHLDNFIKYGECDFSYSLHGLGRFRVNVFRQRGTVALVMRIIKPGIPQLENLGLPDAVKDFTRKNKGLVLLSGPSGSGKSTTTAALLNLINETRTGHILTLEDPIEFLFIHKKCIVNQREMGQDSESYNRALKESIRQDPDIVFVGEVRDAETVDVIISAAEAGRLVFASLHTLDAITTIERFIDIFPYNLQHQVRFRLAGVLEGIISQRLLLRKNEKGRVAAAEVLSVTPKVRKYIREGCIDKIYEEIAAGGPGMQTMDSHIKALYENGIISKEDMLANVLEEE